MPESVKITVENDLGQKREYTLSPNDAKVVSEGLDDYLDGYEDLGYDDNSIQPILAFSDGLCRIAKGEG